MPSATTILPPLGAGQDRCRHGSRIGTKDYGKRLICDACERARQTAMVMTTPERINMKTSPWPDFAGNEIAEGDILIHPNGKKGYVMFDQSGAHEGVNRWRMVYENGISLWLGDQISKKGKAVRPEAKNMHAEKFDDRRNGWSFFARRSVPNEIRIKTTYDTSQITQEVTGSGPDWRSISGHVLNKEVIRLRDVAVREALIRMGWTPPSEEDDSGLY